MSRPCLASGPVMLPSRRRLPRSLRTEQPALARQPLQTCTDRTGSWSCSQVALSADPLAADLPHRGARTRVTAHSIPGPALPQVPRSKARPDSNHVAVVLAMGRAPSAAVMMRLELSSSFLLSRSAMPFEGFSSPAAVPRHRGLCPHVRRLRHPVTRVATRDGMGTTTGPQGLAPLPNSLPSSMLPSRATRSFLGLAYRQDFSPISRMRNVVLVLTWGRVRVGCASAPKRSRCPDRHDGSDHESPKRLGPDLRGTITGSRSTQFRPVTPSTGDGSPFDDDDFIGSKPPKRLRSSR